MLRSVQLTLRGKTENVDTVESIHYTGDLESEECTFSSYYCSTPVSDPRVTGNMEVRPEGMTQSLSPGVRTGVVTKDN